MAAIKSPYSDPEKSCKSGHVPTAVELQVSCSMVMVMVHIGDDSEQHRRMGYVNTTMQEVQVSLLPGLTIGADGSSCSSGGLLLFQGHRLVQPALNLSSTTRAL